MAARVSAGIGAELERLAMQVGIKPAMRGAGDDVEAAAARLRARGLFVEVDAEAGLFYAARSEAGARALRDAERPIRPWGPPRPPDAEVLDAHRTLGRLLGFPRCCVDAFLVRLARGVTVRADGSHAEERVIAVEDALARSEAILGRLNVCVPDRLVPFEPCRFDCALASRYAGALFAAYSARAPAAAERLHHALMRPVLVAPGLELRPSRF